MKQELSDSYHGYAANFETFASGSESMSGIGSLFSTSAPTNTGNRM